MVRNLYITCPFPPTYYFKNNDGEDLKGLMRRIDDLFYFAGGGVPPLKIEYDLNNYMSVCEKYHPITSKV